MTPASLNEYRKKFTKTIKLVSAATGLVYSIVPHTVMNKVEALGLEIIPNNVPVPNTDTKIGHLAHARTIRGIFRMILKNKVCSGSLGPEYVKENLENKHTDSTVAILAYHYSSKPGNPIMYRLAGVLTWSVSDAIVILGDDEIPRSLRRLNADADIRIAYKLNNVRPNFYSRSNDRAETMTAAQKQAIINSAFMTLVEEGRIAEIDLVCGSQDNPGGQVQVASELFSNPNPNDVVKVQGAGRGLILFAMSKIMAMKRHGRRRFEGIITYLASAIDDVNVFPLESTVLSLGFVKVEGYFYHTENALYPSKRNYYALYDRDGKRWEHLAGDGVQWDNPIARICPISKAPNARTRKMNCIP